MRPATPWGCSPTPWSGPAEAADAETTYRDLYERVADVMLRHNRRQTPQLEGELDRLLFAGTVRPAPVYVPVTADPGG